MQKLPQIAVVYASTPAGVTDIKFAASLAQALGRDEMTVLVDLHDFDRSQQTSLIRRLKQQIREITELAEGQITIDLRPDPGQFSSDVIAVGTAFARSHRQVVPYSLVAPKDESSVFGRGKGPVLIPFGDGVSELDAARFAIPLAASLAADVVFYHTTWKDKDVSSEDAQAHMCVAALDNLELLQRAASEHGVRHQSVLETADDVVEGILRCAMRTNSRLIAIARSTKVTVGCYVTQVLRCSPVPVLVTTRERGSHAR